MIVCAKMIFFQTLNYTALSAIDRKDTLLFSVLFKQFCSLLFSRCLLVAAYIRVLEIAFVDPICSSPAIVFCLLRIPLTSLLFVYCCIMLAR